MLINFIDLFQLILLIYFNLFYLFQFILFIDLNQFYLFKSISFKIGSFSTRVNTLREGRRRRDAGAASPPPKRSLRIAFNFNSTQR